MNKSLPGKTGNAPERIPKSVKRFSEQDALKQRDRTFLTIQFKLEML